MSYFEFHANKTLRALHHIYTFGLLEWENASTAFQKSVTPLYTATINPNPHSFLRRLLYARRCLGGTKTRTSFPRLDSALITRELITRVHSSAENPLHHHSCPTPDLEVFLPTNSLWPLEAWRQLVALVEPSAGRCGLTSDLTVTGVECHPHITCLI